MVDDWYGPETAWWAKHEHAQDHLERLRGVCAGYRSTNPLEVRPEPTDVPGETAYRLRQSAPIPVAISLIVGDLVHCLRSSLDSLVFGIVRHSLGRDMTEKEEMACQFPICSSPDDFNRFFTRPRAKIMDDRVRRALHGVQPFFWLENMKMISVKGAKTLSYEEDSRLRPLTSVARLSNIDKHRRLTVTAWWPSLFYWTVGKNDSGDFQWRASGVPPWDDGAIIGYVTGTGSEPPKFFHEFDLVIIDATTHSSLDLSSRDLIAEAEEWVAGVEVALRQMIGEYTQLPPRPSLSDPQPLGEPHQPEEGNFLGQRHRM
jgi:hypothetical protein